LVLAALTDGMAFVLHKQFYSSSANPPATATSISLRPFEIS